MKLDPPRLTVGPLSGAIYVVTHGKVIGEKDGRELIQASTKYDITDQFHAICAEVGDRETTVKR